MIAVVMGNAGLISAHSGTYSGTVSEDSTYWVNIVSWPWGESCGFNYAFGEVEAYATAYAKFQHTGGNRPCTIGIQLHYEGTGYAPECHKRYDGVLSGSGCNFYGGWVQSQKTYYNHDWTQIQVTTNPDSWNTAQVIDLFIDSNGPSSTSTSGTVSTQFCGNYFDYTAYSCPL